MILKRSLYLISVFISCTFGEIPSFSFVGTVNCGGAPIVGNIGEASPAPVDWDGDGDLDLLMGEFGENVYPAAATIRLFTNNASSPNVTPQLTGGEFLNAGGSRIELSAG